MSKTARMIDDRSSARGRLFVMTDAELAMGASALGIFAEAAFVAYCSVSTAEPAVMRRLPRSHLTLTVDSMGRVV